MPNFSAATATHLAELPHIFIMVGSLDRLVNQDIDYANRLIMAGVPTDFIVLYSRIALKAPDKQSGF